MLGAAAQAALPYLQKTLADQAVIDLKPFTADAKKRMAAAAGDFTGQANGVSANVAINDVRLLGIAFDDKTLRVITDAKGTVTVAITSLEGQDVYKRQQPQRFRLGGDAFLHADALQVLDQQRRVDPPQIETLAAREHGDRDLADFRRREHELGVRRRFCLLYTSRCV